MKSRSFTLMLVLMIGLVGCSDDDDNGGTAPPTTGTVVINPQPEGLDAPWEITGPDGYSADDTGSAELAGRAPGDYTIVWGAVDDHETPAGETQYLAAGLTITFTGVYVEDEDPTPPLGFVYIPAGTFVMGSPEDEPGHWEGEGPQHQVTLTQGFYMSQYEVTEEWWAEVMDETPTTSQLPKNYVSWDMAVEFCNALSLQQGLTPAYTIGSGSGNVTWDPDANGYRLPTEAEWEYACRAGSTTAFANGPITNTSCDDPILDQIGWYCGNRTYEEGPAVIGQKQSNVWGLYDMHGSLWEWVWCGLREYTSGAQQDPVTSPAPGAYRVLRGGRWYDYAQHCRSAYRHYADPAYGYSDLGFRPVRSAF
jgi:formylglycine-generating enzyme required for sulfatase activity